MDARADEPGSAEPVRLDLGVSAPGPGIGPRWRVPLLVLGFASLALGIAGGLSRLMPAVPALPGAIALHGAVMVSGFLGTVIGLERAVALGRPWAYLAPLGAGLGGAAVLSGIAIPGLFLMAAGAAAFCAASLAVAARQLSLETVALLAGAVAWLAGCAFLGAGWPAEPWWIAFLALTIAAERLELSRYLKRSEFSRTSFGALAAGIALSALDASMKIQGALLTLLALWLFAFDLARITVRQHGLARYVALCLLAGYFWLGVAGVLFAAGALRDAALHAFFLGFVFSMVFGHAPVILPAVLRISLPYQPILYVPLALLHGSLAVRVAGAISYGAWGNAAAAALFILTAATLAIRASSARPRRSAPAR